ncbi:unnamed protein product [Mytilus edulis]|uniref:Uncharacterized protein n=1 Tax=Mytilus edulis TaxID=6550 RepID=A0A8S3RLZ7_MYTED|nr:unnamed protein product [Mytilus edulis]
MPGYFDGHYVFDIAAEINVIGHNTLSDKRLSKLLWKKIEERENTQYSRETIFLFLKVNYTDFIDFALKTIKGDTILHIFVSSLPSQTILEKILSADDNLLNIVNEEGMTALMLVNNEECLKVLMKHKPDVSIRDHKNNTALHHLLNRENIGPAIPEEIIQQNQSLLNAKNDDGVSPIMKAKDDECFNCLLRLNADISLTDNMNQNILHYCSKWSDCICVEIIRRNSKLVYQKDKENKTPIMILAEGENADCVRIMLKHDENLKYVNKDTGTTLLHIAARYGCFAICQTILIQTHHY